jgi:hypothetical protein
MIGTLLVSIVALLVAVLGCAWLPFKNSENQNAEGIEPAEPWPQPKPKEGRAR